MAMKSFESWMSAPNCSLRAAVAVRSRCTTPASANVSTHTAAFGAPGSPGTGPAETDQVLPFMRVDPVAAAPRNACLMTSSTVSFPSSSETFRPTQSLRR